MMQTRRVFLERVAVAFDRSARRGQGLLLGLGYRAGGSILAYLHLPFHEDGKVPGPAHGNDVPW